MIRSFTGLPDPILVAIFKKLAMTETIELSRTCQKMHDVAFANRLPAWRSVELLITEQNSGLFVTFLNKIAEFVEKLRIRVNVQNRNFRAFLGLKKLPNLKEVHFDHCKLCANFIWDLCANSPSVTFVILDEVTALSSYFGLCDNISDPFRKYWSWNLSNLHFYTMGDEQRQISHEGFRRLVRYRTCNPNHLEIINLLTTAKWTLKEFAVTKGLCLTDRVLTLLSDCEKLETVHISLTRSGDLTRLSCMRHLTRMFVFKKIGDTLVPLLDQCVFRLSQFAILGRDEVSDDLVNVLVSRHTVSVASFWSTGSKLSDTGLRKFITSPKLRTFQFYDMHKVSQGKFLAEVTPKKCRLTNLFICASCAGDELKKNLDIFKQNIPNCNVISDFGIMCRHRNDQKEESLTQIPGFEALIPGYNPYSYRVKENSDYRDFLVEENDRTADSKTEKTHERCIRMGRQRNALSKEKRGKAE